MKEKDVVRYFDNCMSECRDAVKTIRKQQESNLALYMCRKDFTKKQDWQFRLQVPFAKPKVKRAVNLIKTTLLRADQYFDFETPVRSQNDPKYLLDLKRCNITKRLMKAHLDSKHCNFVPNFCESLEAAFGWAGLMVMKFWVGYVNSGHFDMPRNEYVKREELALRCKAIDPFLFDFTPDRRIQIEHQYVTMPEFWAGVESGDFDKKTAKKLMSNDYGDRKNMGEEDKKRLARLGIDNHHNEYRKEIKLSHFWGPLIGKDNKVEKDHVHFFIANDKYLITEILDNPYPDKSTPYVFDNVITVPFRHIGKALCQDVNTIEDAFNDFLGLQGDNALWQALGVTEMDQFSITSQDKNQLSNLYPGVPIVRRPGSAELAFKRHEMGYDPTRMMPFMNELKALHDADIGMEFISPNIQMNSEAADPTGRRQDAISQFEGVATDLERGMFCRCIDKARDLVMQFMSDPGSNPNAETILGQEGIVLDQMSEEERKSLIVSEYDIVARGVSIFFERMRKLNAYTGLYKVLNALPKESLVWIKFENILKDILNIVALDETEDKIRTPDEVKQIQQQQAAQRQQMMQLEIQKHIVPLQTKLQQTQMGIQERTQLRMAELQTKLKEVAMKLEQRDREAELKAQTEGAKLLFSEKQHRDKMVLGAAGLHVNKMKADQGHLADLTKLALSEPKASTTQRSRQATGNRYSILNKEQAA